MIPVYPILITKGIWYLRDPRSQCEVIKSSLLEMILRNSHHLTVRIFYLSSHSILKLFAQVVEEESECILSDTIIHG